MARDTENQHQQDINFEGGCATQNRKPLNSGSLLHFGLLDDQGQYLDKAHDYRLEQGKGETMEQVNANLHLGDKRPEQYYGMGETTDGIVEDAGLRQPSPELAPQNHAALSDAATYQVNSLSHNNGARNSPATGIEVLTNPSQTGDDGHRQVSGAVPQEDDTDADLIASNLTSVTDVERAVHAVEENSAIGASIGISASASVVESASLTYSLLDDVGGLFSIDPETGILTVAGELYAESAGSHQIVVLATASDGSTSSETFTLTIADENEFPVSNVVETDASDNTIAEDAAAGTQVGVTALATDAVSCSVDDSRFNVDSTGVVGVAAGASFDAETEGSIDVNVTATSTGGSTSSETFSIAVSDVNETAVSTVTDADASDNTIAEYAAAGTRVGVTALATDADATDAVSYTLNDDRFNIDADGVVTIADHAFFDSQVENEIHLTVTATSTDGSETTESFSISVTGNYDRDITGSDGSGRFDGSGQSYFVDGAGGNDNITTGDYNDRIDGGISGGNDNLNGGGGDDLIFGRNGVDVIFGGTGDDTIVGGGGNDNLHGGDGSDLFMYGLGDGHDVIHAGAGVGWTDVIDLGGGPGILSAGEYGTDWTVTITNGSIQSIDQSNGLIDLSHDASGHIDFSDGSRVIFNDVEEIHW